MSDSLFDLIIIGGGINGTAIARDASGRGLSVCLLEQNDLASGASSASTKLIHGGLQYLEEFRLPKLREAVTERGNLLNAAPHIVSPIRLIFPHQQGQRRRWSVRLGFLLYDLFGNRHSLPPTRTVNFDSDETGEPLLEKIVRGWQFSDCIVDDARLAVLNAVDARSKGAVIRPRTKIVSAARTDARWEAVTEQGEVIKARALVVAAGAWRGDTHSKVLKQPEKTSRRLVKFSHIVVDKLYDHDKGYVFQSSDGRYEFAIPYQGNFTLIGMTELDDKGPPGPVSISDLEIDYLTNTMAAYFHRNITREAVRWSFSGYKFEREEDHITLEGATGEAPLLSVTGHEINFSRKHAEDAVEKLRPYFPGMKAKWTRHAKLPGGMSYHAIKNYLAAQKQRYSFLKPANVERMFHAYGNRMDEIIGKSRFASDLGKWFGPLSEREIEFLKQEEFATTAEDILWRRSKLGLLMAPEEIEALRRHLKELPHKPAKMKERKSA